MGSTAGSFGACAGQRAWSIPPTLPAETRRVVLINVFAFILMLVMMVRIVSDLTREPSPLFMALHVSGIVVFCSVLVLNAKRHPIAAAVVLGNAFILLVIVQVLRFGSAPGFHLALL